MTMDFFPTFAQLAGAATPPGHVIDGLDLMPLLRNQTGGMDRELHWLFGDAWAVRHGPWKLIGRGDAALSLVNLDNDPAEGGNSLREQPERVDRMMKLHRQWIAAVGGR